MVAADRAARIYDVGETPPPGRVAIVALQHVVVMVASMVAASRILGLNPGVTLLCSGAGTLLFHLVTKGKIPLFLGSSFGLTGALAAAAASYGANGAFVWVVSVGFAYVIVAAVIAADRRGTLRVLRGRRKALHLARFRGESMGWLKRVFPASVTGPLVIVVALTLAPAAVREMERGWIAAFASVAVVVGARIFGRRRELFVMAPILLGMAGGYLAALGSGGVDFRAVGEAPWLIGFRVISPSGHLPSFGWAAVVSLVPMAIAAIVADVGTLYAASGVLDRNLARRPGLHRMLLGNGLATMLSGLSGGLPQSAYPEDIGVLALIGVWSARAIEWAAGMAMVLSVSGKLAALVATIPQSVMGGVTVVLSGLVAWSGVRMMVRSDVDLWHMRELLVASTILALGVGGLWLKVKGVVLAGVGPAAVVGIVLNLVLSRPKASEAEEERKKAASRGVREAAWTLARAMERERVKAAERGFLEVAEVAVCEGE